MELQTEWEQVDLFPELSVTTHVELSADSVAIQQSVLVRNKIYHLPSPGFVSKAFRRLQVTDSCGHRYNASFPRIAFEKNCSDGTEIRCIQGLFFEVLGDWSGTPGLELWLQAVDQNVLGQWLGIQSGTGPSTFTILQRNCCLTCIEKMARKVAHLRARDPNRAVVSVVHGRFPGENIE